ncbi:MAG: aldo/keto reductase [Cyclobacteriaceae bacterium]
MATTFEFAPLTVGTMRLGDWGAKLNTAQIQKFIEDCLETGLTDFDHADIYGDYTTEADFGKALKASPVLKDQIRIITKCGIRMVGKNRPTHRIKSYDLSAAHIRQSVENSLNALSVEKIDVLLLHRPDILLDPHEVAEVFERLRSEGKVQYFGVSNFTPSQFEMLNNATELITNQVEVSVVHLKTLTDGTIDQCMLNNLRPMAWSPLGGGELMGNPKDERLIRIKKTSNRLAEKYGIGLDQLLLAWLLRHPAGIIPVLGTSKSERIRKAVKALDIKLSREEWYDLLQASTGSEVA